MPDIMDCGHAGRCDFCQFSSLKIFPLTCMRHFYCQTCRQFVKSLQKKDFSCKLCERKQRQIQSDRRRESHILDSFIEETATERRARHFQEVPITMSGSQVIPLDNDKDEVDHHDLTGNNEEWDLLISSLSYQPSCAEKQPAPTAHDDKQLSPKKQPADRHLKKGTSRCNTEGKEKPTPPPSADKHLEESRIYDWCVAAKNSLTSTKMNGAFGQASNQTVTLSSSSENNMAKMKYNQQKKKKERPFWWDEDQSDSDADWDECFSDTTPFFKRTSGKAEQDEHYQDSMRKRNCTPEAGFHLRTAIFNNICGSLTDHETDVQRSLFKEDGLFTRQNTGQTLFKNSNMEDKDSSHQTDMFKEKAGSFRNDTEQSGSTHTKPSDKDDADLMSRLFKDTRVDSKDQIFKREWPPRETAKRNSPVLDGSSQEQLMPTGNRTWLNREPSISPVDFTDSFWDQ